MYVRRSASVLFVLVGILTGPAHAVKMDETTHDLLIQRLELATQNMDSGDNEKPGAQARLADLYADRARLKAMNEVSGECKTDCKASRYDRKRAIDLYNQALPNIGADDQGRIILQIAHLYNLNEESGRAITLYKKVVAAKKGYSSAVRGLAFSALGEIQFKKGNFKAAQAEYEKARREELSSRAFVEYRIAWCQLNQGQVALATTTLTRLLQTPDLLATQTTEGKAVDPAFVADVSSDLARFLARGPVRPQDIEQLKSLSPDSNRKDNLKTLAEETDRLGKKEAALNAWAAYVDEGQVAAEEKIEVQTKVAQIHYDMNHQTEAAEAFEKALALWKKLGCKKSDICTETRSNLKRFVTSWNKAQGKKPTESLFRAYAAYNDVFEDAEMLHWAAQVGASLKKYREAGDLFHKAAEIARSKGPKGIFEGSLLGQIEMAEASKDVKARESAYNYYLSVNAQGPEALQVRYQRAHLFYDTKRFKDAYNEFHYIANSPGADPSSLKVQSADLALDSLVALKDDASLELRGIEYARLFPGRKMEYLKISRKATLNIVANNLKSTRADYKANLVALNKVNLDGADEKERIQYFKNKMLVAEKAMDLKAVESSANSLIAIRGLSDNDRESAMERKVWVAELELNFQKSYELTKSMDLRHLSKADRELRLALLAELAGLNSRRHNEAYLRLTKNVRAGNLVRISLIKSARSPWREFDKHLAMLKKTPDLLAGISLETFARDPNFSRAEKLLKTTSIRRYAAGATLARQIELKNFARFDRKIRAHRLYGYSDKAMQKTIRERIRLIGEAEHETQLALKKKDWTLKMVYLALVARENRRFEQDILKLPVPARLNKEQRAQYISLLKSQSEPYATKAAKIETDLEQMWSSSGSVQNLQSAYMTASPELQKVYRGEISTLAAVAPPSAQKRLKDLLNTPFKRPSQKDILVARKDLQANPFDVGKAKTLRDLEALNGRPSMVVYLDERITQLKTGKNL